MPISSGSSRLAKRSETQKFPLTHVHFFDDEAESSLELASQLERLATRVRAEERGFRVLRSGGPFDVGVEAHFAPTLDATLPMSLIAVCARLRVGIDIDLYWSDDFRVEELPGDLFVGGALQVRGEDWHEPWRWADVPLGRLVAGSLRRHRETKFLTFHIVGGYGRPMAGFSAAAVNHLANANATARILVEPGWPFVPHSPSEEPASSPLSSLAAPRPSSTARG